MPVLLIGFPIILKYNIVRVIVIGICCSMLVLDYYEICECNLYFKTHMYTI